MTAATSTPSRIARVLSILFLAVAAGTHGAPAMEPRPPGLAGEEPNAAGADEPRDEEDEESSALERYPERTFRLYARRDVSPRLRPNVGLRVPLLAPRFSPETPDFAGRPRETGALFDGAVNLAGLRVDGGRRSAKGQEFRDLDDGGVIGADLWYRNRHGWVRLTGRHLGLADADLDLELRGFGLVTGRFTYSEIPHNYAFAVPSLYSGVGSGTLEIDDDVQAMLQQTSSPEAAARTLQSLLDTRSSRVDLEHGRERFGLDLDINAFDPLAIEVVLRDESRRGTRPWSGSFGLANVVEVPWPVSYDSKEHRVTVEWVRGGTLLRGSHRDSRFGNRISDLSFDNPWRLTDSVGPSLQDFRFGPAAGRIDLYPDNRQAEQTLTAVQRNLPGNSTLAVTLSVGQLEQDDALLPYTSNSAIDGDSPFGPGFDASHPSTRPATSAAAEIETSLLHLRFSSQPVDFLQIKVQVRDYELDNETRQIFTPGLVLEDAVWRPYFGAPEGAFTNLPIAYGTRTSGLDLAFDLAKRTQLTLSYASEEWSREFREVERTKENRYQLTLDSKPAKWVDLRASVLHWEKRMDRYDFAQFFARQGIDFLPVLPSLLKFDQASRDRDRVQIMASFFPTASLSVGAHLIRGVDDYPESSFGVTGDDHAVVAADLSYLIGERTSFFLSYSFERSEMSLRGREWSVGGPGDPYLTETGLESASNWSAEPRDDLRTIALGLDAELLHDRLHLDVAYSYSASDGRIGYSSPIGGLDANPFEPVDFPEVDDTTFFNFNPELELTLGARMSLVLGYMKEKYELDDFATQGLRLVPTTPSGAFNGALFMGSFPFDFDLEVAYVELEIDL